MQYLICYDIADDKRRERTAKVLLDYGRRVQESVFFATLDGELVEEMGSRLKRSVEPDEDSLLVIALCGSCQSRVEKVGRADLPQDEDFYIV